MVAVGDLLPHRTCQEATFRRVRVLGAKFLNMVRLRREPRQRRFAHGPTAYTTALFVAVMLAGISAAIGSFGAPGFAGTGVALGADDGPLLDRSGVPVRIRIPDLGIDLPVVSSDRNVRGNPEGYPLCDVAQYWTRYDNPGTPGTTWIYGHAQPGMFLPLVATAEATDGEGLLDRIVALQLRDGRLLRYRITEVRQHARNAKIAKRPNDSQHRLVLQTSEGPPGTVPKLLVAARLIGASRTDERPPKAQPRACSQPLNSAGDTAPRSNPDRSNTSTRPETQTVVAVADADDSMSLALGAGVVLLTAVLLATAIARQKR